MDTPQVGRDSGDGILEGAEARELRVVLVTPRAAEKHRLREQGLAPHGDEPGGVEMPGVQCPETQGDRARVPGRADYCPGCCAGMKPTSALSFHMSAAICQALPSPRFTQRTKLPRSAGRRRLACARVRSAGRNSP